MYTEYLGPIDRNNLSNSMCMFEKTARKLQQGQLIAIPTETIYGLGGVILNNKAINQIFAVKSRSKKIPLPIAVTNIDQIRLVVDKIPERCHELINAFCPGPLTIILKKASNLSPLITGEKETVAIRFPSDPITLRLIEMVGCPLALPSANISGQPSPTKVSHVLEDFNGLIDGVLDGGETEYGMESTLISFENPDEPVLLRHGVIPHSKIEKALKMPVKIHPLTLFQKGNTNPGQTSSALRIFSSWNEIKIYLQLSNYGKRLIMSNEDLPSSSNYECFKLTEKNLYDGLRLANRNGYTEVLVYCSKTLMQKEPLMQRLKQIAIA